MRIYLILFFALLLSCGNLKNDFDALQEDNKLLKKELANLQTQFEEMKYLANHSEVTLANTEIKTLKSSHNGQKYQIKVKLPKGYEDGTGTYPVLYVTDAETNFGGVTYIVQRLIKDRLIPPILVVGIAYNTDYKSFYKRRSRDLTPIESEMGSASNPDPTGGAGKFCDFLSNELFPFITKNYRVQNDERALYGHSYGGLFGTHVFSNRTDLFNKYLLLSPSLWYANNYILDEVKKVDFDIENTQLYFASGDLEPRINDLQTELVNKLKNKKIKNLNLKAEVMENETHRTIFGAGFTNGLRFIYAE